MRNHRAEWKPSRRQALITAGLAAVGVPFSGWTRQPTPQPTPAGRPSAELTAAQSDSCCPNPERPYIVGISPDGTYFIDEYGHPRLMLVDNPWALIFNAGEWSSGDWQSEMDNYLNSRSSQGFTGLYLSALGNLDNGGSYLNGNTWDNIPPFTGGGHPSAGLNNAYWQRVDYLISTAESYGLTVFLNIAYTSSGLPGNFDSGAVLDYKVLTPTEYADYGTAVAKRYASSPNLVWMYGNDYFGGYLDTQFGYIRNAIVATGDTHAMGVHVYPESTSRYDIETATDSANGTAFGYDHSQIDWVYSYNVTYFGVERAFEEAAAHNIRKLPPVWGDGLFWGGQDQPMRQMAWWALSSGARGCNTGDNNVWAWDSGSPAAVTGDGDWAGTQAGIARSLIESLPGWHTLSPDTSSALVTAGRGTHAKGISTGNNYVFGTDDYVTASRTPDTGKGSALAVIYGAKAYSITINQAKMVPGYTATWVDPTNGAKTAATPGATYNSGSLGNNSAGDPDWVLVLQARPPVISTAALPAGVISKPYSATLHASYGTGTYSWHVTAGSLPPGLALSHAGVIHGTPGKAGHFSFTVTVTDSPLHSASKTLAITIAPIAVKTSALAPGTVHRSYKTALAVYGGKPPFSWTIISGKLPQGLKLSKPGTISGTPVKPGRYTFTVKVTDATKHSAKKVLTIIIRR